MQAVSTHTAGKNLTNYCESLVSEEINVEPIPRIIFEVYKGCHELVDKYFLSYHSAVFKIVDSDNYLIEFDKKI